MNIIKSPQDNIEAYLYNEINIEIFDENMFDEPERLIFFNLLFKEFEFFCENNSNYLAIINHFESYRTYRSSDDTETEQDKFADIQLLYDYLYRLISDKYPEDKRTGVLIKTCEYMEEIDNRVSDLFMTGIEPMNNFNRVEEFIESLSNEEKLTELIKYKHLYIKFPDGFQKSQGYTFGDRCKLEIEKITELIKFKATQSQQIETINEPEQKLPYKIALLHELGFFKLDAIKKLTKENQFKIISSLTGGTHRTVKGNVNVLDSNSNEDRIKYTSNNYKDEVKIYLDKLK